jgi:hypothetical protein
MKILTSEPIASSDITSVAYDSKHGVLQLEFRATGFYHYYGVPTTIYKGIKTSPHHCKFFLKHIKGKFSYEKLKPSEPPTAKVQSQ